MVRKVLAEFDAVDGPFINKLRRIDKSVTRFERGTLRSFGRVEQGMSGLLSSATKLRTVSGIFATGFGTSLAVGFLDQSKQIRNALREAGDSSQEMYEDVFRASVRSLSGFKDFAQGVQRMQKALGSSQGLQKTIRDMETLNKLLALSGKTAQERSSTMIQFSQALQAGYLQGEELRAIRENAPIEFTRAIAKEAGGTIQDLKALAKEGKLTTEVMIRALQSLEEEADLRFGKIEVTINDATKLFQSGAIVAAEGFDKGLGFSRASVAGLKQIGDILGENAEAAETFGKATKYTAAVMASSFAGRKINAFTTSMQNLSKARIADVVAAEREYAVTTKLVAKKRLALSASNATLLALQRTAPASDKAAKAAKAVTRARTQLTAATARQTAAMAAAQAAQTRLLLTSRLLAGGMNVLKGAFAFLGGIPGLLLIAGTAFLTMSANAETAAEKMERLTRINTGLEGATENARAVMERLNEVIKDRGDLSLVAAATIVAATEQEFKAKQTLLRLEKVQEQRAQAERVRELAHMKVELEAARRKSSEFKRVIPNAGSDPALAADFNKFQDEKVAQLSETVRNLEADYDRLDAVIVLTAQSISNSNEIIGASFDIEAPTDFIAKVDEASAAAEKFIRKNMSSEQQMADVLKEVTAAREVLLERQQQMIEAHGEESEEAAELTGQISNLDAAMAQFQSELQKTKTDADALTGAALTLHNALSQLGSLHLSLSDRLTGARAKIAAIGAGASQSQAEAMSSGLQQGLNVMRAGGSLSEIANAYTETVRLNTELSTANEQLNKLTKPAKSSGGGGGKGGGSGSSVSQLEKDVTQFIASMMTAEERQAKQLREVIKLREELVATYGKGHKLIIPLNEAIGRLHDDIDGLSDSTEDFFKSLSDGISSSINDWQGWGDFVGNILASFFDDYGQAFLSALFTPGAQSGTDLGTTIGNWVTGNGGSGSNSSTSKLGSLSASKMNLQPMPALKALPTIPKAVDVNLPTGLKSASDSSLSVHIHENASEGRHRVERSSGRVDVFLKNAVSDVIGGGGADNALRNRFGMKPSAKGA